MGKTRIPPASKTDKDGNLKEIIQVLFKEAVRMMNPSLYRLIDWRIPVEFLEQELRQINRTHFRGAKRCDVLAKFQLKSGATSCALLHWEIEGDPRKGFGERMDKYRCLLRIRHDIEDIAAMVLYIGGKSIHQTDHYRHLFANALFLYRFPIYKVWEQDEQKLLKSRNPFALVILAILYVLRTTGNFDDRLLFKEKLYELAERKKMPSQKLSKLLTFVDNFMFLAPKWETTFNQYLLAKQQKQNQKAMNFNTPVVRRRIDHQFAGFYGEFPKEMVKRVKKETRAEMQKIVDASLQKVKAAEKAKEAAEEAKAAAEKAKEAAEEAKAAAEKAKEEAKAAAKKAKEEAKVGAEKAKEEAKAAAEKAKEEAKAAAEKAKEEAKAAAEKAKATNEKAILALFKAGLKPTEIATQLELEEKLVSQVLAKRRPAKKSRP